MRRNLLRWSLIGAGAGLIVGMVNLQISHAGFIAVIIPVVVGLAFGNRIGAEKDRHHLS